MVTKSQLEHSQVQKRETEPGVRKGKRLCVYNLIFSFMHTCIMYMVV